jgi:hypothetical protein
MYGSTVHLGQGQVFQNLFGIPVGISFGLGSPRWISARGTHTHTDLEPLTSNGKPDGEVRKNKKKKSKEDGKKGNQCQADQGNLACKDIISIATAIDFRWRLGHGLGESSDSGATVIWKTKMMKPMIFAKMESGKNQWRSRAIAHGPQCRSEQGTDTGRVFCPWHALVFPGLTAGLDRDGLHPWEPYFNVCTVRPVRCRTPLIMLNIRNIERSTTLTHVPTVEAHTLTTQATRLATACSSDSLKE